MLKQNALHTLTEPIWMMDGYCKSHWTFNPNNVHRNNKPFRFYSFNRRQYVRLFLSNSTRITRIVKNHFHWLIVAKFNTEVLDRLLVSNNPNYTKTISYKQTSTRVHIGIIHIPTHIYAASLVRKRKTLMVCAI